MDLQLLKYNPDVQLHIIAIDALPLDELIKLAKDYEISLENHKIIEF